MSRKSAILAILLILGGAVAIPWMPDGAWFVSHAAQSTTQQGQLLSGLVRSSSGNPLEGVAVSAWLLGTPVTTTVFTDAQGGYYFPPLPAGKYRVRAQAVGFEKEEAVVDVSDAARPQDFKVREKKEFFLQLTGDQQLAAWPEVTPAQRRMKDVFLRNCTGCHEANVALQNRFDQRGWEAIITSMGKIGANGFSDPDRPENRVTSYFKKDLAAYLAEVRGPGTSSVQQPSLPPRPTGEATLPVVYEYDVPVESADGYLPNNGSDWSLGPSAGSGGGIGLHDAHPDQYGDLWLTDNTEGSITRTVAKVDGRTGNVTKFKYPGKNEAAHTHGVAVARDGMVWFTMNTLAAFGGPGNEVTEEGVPGGIFGRLDPRTGTIDAFTTPKGTASATVSIDEDGLGNIWAATPRGAVRLNPKTREFKEFLSVTPGTSYGMTGDRHGTGWWTQMGLDIIGFSDVATGTSKEIKLPPGTYNVIKDGDLSPEDLKMYGPRGTGAQMPRRLAADPSSDDIWVPNYAGQTLLRINSKTLKTTFYQVPRWGANPYMAGVDSRGNVWMNLQNGDDLAKFDPKTDKWTFYSWPSRGTSSRGMHLLDHDGTLQLSITYWNASRVARMVIRTQDEVDALRWSAQSASAR